MVSVSRAPEDNRRESSRKEFRKEQIPLINDAIERDHEENKRGAAIVVVVREESSAEEVEKEWKIHSWQSHKRRPFVRATRRERLQDTIREVSRNDDINHLTIIACEGISKISPRVHAPRIQNMRILSCVSQDRSQHEVKIGKSSKFNSKHLRDYAPRHGYNNSREFNCNVNITLEQEKPSIPHGNESDLSDNKKEEHEAHSPKGTQETNTSGGWWKSWRGTVAGAVGLTVAAVKAVSSVTIAAKGYCLSLSWKSFSLFLSNGSATASLSTSAVCVAAAYGLIAFLVVYLVPWGDLFNWFDSTAQSWYNGVLSWWNRGVASGRRGREYSRVI